MPGMRSSMSIPIERTVGPRTHKPTVARVGGVHAVMQAHALGTAGFACCLGQCREWSCCSLHHTLLYYRLGTR